MTTAAIRDRARVLAFERKCQPKAPSCTIGAHADFRPEDYVFRRAQSYAMRNTPWRRRTRPLKSWSEIAALGLVLGAGTLVVLLSTAFI